MRMILATCVLAAAACGQNPYEATVEGVLLADATGVVPAEDGPLVKLTLDDLEPTFPDAPVVRLAIARDVSWGRVQTTLAALRDKGIRPVLLVGKRDAVHGFVLSEEVGEVSIHLTATPDGKFCVGRTGIDEARCVTSADRKHIHRAFVREHIRDAVKAYGLDEVDVVVTPDLQWADVVRTIDGARTCCKGTPVKVKLLDG